MLGSRHEIARLQSDFYRDQYRRMLRWLLISVILMFILILAIIYVVIFKPVPNYFGNTTEGAILVMPQPVQR